MGSDEPGRGVCYFDEDGYLTLTGRIEEFINRGGEKVSPYEVDTAMLEHPDVLEAAAFAIPHPTLGQIVGAAIVPARKHSPTEANLRHFLSDRLAAFKVPQAFLFVDQIPKGPTGKFLRKRLTDMFKAVRQRPSSH